MPKFKALSRVQKRQVRAIAAKTVESKAEDKVQDDGPTNRNWNSTLTQFQLQLSSGSQGDLNNDREGDQIQIKSIHLKGSIAPGTDQNNVMRMMIVQTTENSATPLSEPPLSGYVNATATDVQDNMNLFYQRKQESVANVMLHYKVIYDNTWYFDSHNASVFRPFDLKITGRQLRSDKITYVTGTGTHDFPIYVLLFGTHSSLGQMLSFSSRIHFIDF